MLDENKKRDIAKRVKSIKEDLIKARAYLETGAHSSWHKFQPLFFNKTKDGKVEPPHRDWVKNVFIPNTEKALSKAEALLDRDV